MGEPARLRGRCFQASQTHINGPTPGNVASSRRAVGLSAPMFLASITVGAYAIRPYEHHMYGRIAYALMPKTFPLQSLSHARPRHHHVSRRTIQSLRPHLNPAPRTPRPDLLSKKKERHPLPATDMQPLTRLERGSVCAHPRRLRPRQEKLYMGQELMCFVDFYRFSAKYTFVINN